MSLIVGGVCVRPPGGEDGTGRLTGRLDEVTAPQGAEGRPDGVTLAQMGVAAVVARGIR